MYKVSFTFQSDILLLTRLKHRTFYRLYFRSLHYFRHYSICGQNATRTHFVDRREIFKTFMRHKINSFKVKAEKNDNKHQ